MTPRHRIALFAASACVLVGAGLALLVAVRHAGDADPPEHEGPAAGAAPHGATAALVADGPASLRVTPAAGSLDAQTAGDERTAVLAALRESGAAEEPWDVDARALFSTVAQPPVAVVDEGCYVAGCAATFTFPSENDFARRRREIDVAPAYAAWTGGKRWTSSVRRGDGRTVAALVVFRPD